jgi:hypothetical protein
VLDRNPERRILLANDVVETSGVQPFGLQLLIRPTRLDGVMLACIADEQHPIVAAKLREQRVHLPRTGETGFVEHIQVLLCVRPFGRLRQVPLQGH